MNRIDRKKSALALALLLWLLPGAGIAAAQETHTIQKEVRVVTDQTAGGGATATGDAVFVQSTEAIPATPVTQHVMIQKAPAVVKGAPYTAEASTEMVQTLADGNRIVHKNTTSLARDSQGRTRSEQSFDSLGAMVAAADKFRFINIVDPVSGTTYSLNLSSREAYKNQFPGNFAFSHSTGSGTATINESHEMRLSTGPAAGAMVTTHVSNSTTSADSKVESLGSQTILGVFCEGKRITMTIPANAFGNERPIVSVTETWTAPDLQIVMLSTTRDPRFGDTTYKVESISRDEPAASLFEVPADYKLVEGGQRTIQIKKSVKQP